jgi:hypothetical protein
MKSRARWKFKPGDRVKAFYPGAPFRGTVVVTLNRGYYILEDGGSVEKYSSIISMYVFARLGE